MKVLLCSPYGVQTGGISKWTEHIVTCKDLNPEIDITIFPLNRKPLLYSRMSKLRRYWLGISDYWQFYRRFSKKINSEHFDCVHLASSANVSLIKDLLMLRAAKKAGVKSVLHFHFGRIPELAKLNNWEWKLLTKASKMADKVVVLDKMSLDTMKAYGFDNVYELPNPLAPSVVNLVEAEKNHIDIEPRLIVFAGHVVPTKGVEELIKATKQITGVKVKLFGQVNPEYKAKLLSMAGQEDWLEICGAVPFDEVLRQMLKADLFVLPTYTEGFPNVIIEAMAAGCAIATTPVGAIPEMLEEDDEGCYGLMIPPREVESLQKAILRMLDDVQLKQECRANAKGRVKSRYNLEAVMNQLHAIWKNW